MVVDLRALGDRPPPFAEPEEDNVGVLVKRGGVGGVQEENGSVEISVEAEPADFMVGIEIGTEKGDLLVGLVEGGLRMAVRREAEAFDGLEGFRGERGEEAAIFGEERILWSLNRDCHFLKEEEGNGMAFSLSIWWGLTEGLVVRSLEKIRED